MATRKGPDQRKGASVVSFSDVVRALEQKIADERQNELDRLLAQLGSLAYGLSLHGYKVEIRRGGSVDIGTFRKGKEVDSGVTGVEVRNGRSCPICSKAHGYPVTGHDKRSHRYHPKAYTSAEIKSMKDWKADPLF